MTLAMSVQFLIDNRDFVSNADDKESLVGSKVDMIVNKHQISKMSCQWTENYICDVVGFWTTCAFRHLTYVFIILVSQ